MVKRNPDFLLRQVAGKQVVVPVGRAAGNFPGMLTLNETGVFLWECLEEEQTIQSLAQALCEHYEVDAATATEDVERFVKALLPVGAITEQ